MTQSIRCLAVVLSAAAVSVLAACSDGSGGSVTQQGVVTGPSGLKVTATISAATLGDDCGGSTGSFAPSESPGRCAPTDGGADSQCGASSCRQSSMQVGFTTEGTGNARVEVVAVKLLDANAGNEVSSLTASQPQSWNGSTYVTWDQTLSPNGSLKSSYRLSSPGWSAMGTTDTYSREFRIKLTLKIDGVETTLQSAPIRRESAVAPT